MDMASTATRPQPRRVWQPNPSVTERSRHNPSHPPEGRAIHPSTDLRSPVPRSPEAGPKAPAGRIENTSNSMCRYGDQHAFHEKGSINTLVETLPAVGIAKHDASRSPTHQDDELEGGGPKSSRVVRKDTDGARPDMRRDSPRSHCLPSKRRATGQ
jgi:hypothetical protein